MDVRPSWDERKQLAEKLLQEQEQGISRFAKIRRQKAAYLLTHLPSLLYTSLATGHSMEMVRLKVARLLDPNKLDVPDEEQKEFEMLMSNALPADKIPPHILDP